MTALERLLDRSVAAGIVPGVVAVLDRPGAPVETVAVGRTAPGGPPISTDAVFRIMSMTKAITAVAALRLVEAGALSLDDGVEAWLPELRDRRVLVHPDAELDDTVPAAAPITVRHLLTNTSGYGSVMTDSPLGRAMIAGGTETGPAPLRLGCDDWLAALAELPLAFAPGTGWRYHHSFGILGVLLRRLVGRPLGEHLRDDLFTPLGMTDTGFWAADPERLPGAYRRCDDGLLQTHPPAGGFWSAPPSFDVSHGELVSTAADYHLFLRALRDGALLTARHRALMTSDRVPPSAKTPDSFFPGFWDGTGWGFGVGVQTAGPHAGGYGWSGGLGTDFVVTADGAIGILLSQVEMDGALMRLLGDFQEVAWAVPSDAPGE